MQITHLSLTNFRNYGRLEQAFYPGATLLHGNNAQGKTNLLEAIYYLATTRSPHAEYDQQLINWDAAQQEDPIIVGRIVADMTGKQGAHHIEMRLILEKSRQLRNGVHSFRREVLVDKRKIRLMDLLGTLRVVLFLPEDIQLITGSPSHRRRYMDITICQIDPIYCKTLAHYNKVLDQRNALLRQIAEGTGSRDLLPIFNKELITLGAQIFTRRAAFLTNLAREAQHIHYESLTDGGEAIKLIYLPRIEVARSKNKDDMNKLRSAGEWLHDHTDAAHTASHFERALTQAEVVDIARGSTSVGPHRDDWGFLLNGRSLSSFGSRGQQRTALLALKMAEIKWMEQVSGETPILLLDEVVAELDDKRRTALLGYVAHASQAILTATDPGMFTQAFLTQSTQMLVKNGRIQVEQTTT
jgi:DNA replication and repair protein RecF